MLPPTIMTAPTSDIALARPARMAMVKEKRQSQISHLQRDNEGKRRLIKESRCIRQESSRICLLKAAIKGVVRSVWARTIPLGVKSHPQAPRGPDRDSIRYTSTPTITVGTPIRVLRVTIKAFLPLNSSVASRAPTGRPSKVPNKSAVRLTCRETSTMPITPPSKWASRLRASRKAVNMHSILSRGWQNGPNKRYNPNLTYGPSSLPL